MAEVRTDERWRLPHVPARAVAGLGDPASSERGVGMEMDVPEAMRDASGAVVPGALAVLADSVIGYAIVSGAGRETGMATSHLHLELLRPIPAGTDWLHGSGLLCSLEGAFALGEGSITNADGIEIARSTIGAILLEPRTIVPPAESDPSPDVRAYESGCVDVLLGAEFLRIDERRCQMRFRASPDLSNRSNGVHGGMGVLMGERTLDAALRRSGGGASALRLVELRAAFPRPIAANGDAILCHATVVHRGRRLAVVRAELLDPRGRIAVAIDGTYVSA